MYLLFSQTDVPTEKISPYADSDIEVKVGENSTSHSDYERTTPEPNSSTLASSLPPSLTPTAGACHISKIQIQILCLLWLIMLHRV